MDTMRDVMLQVAPNRSTCMYAQHPPYSLHQSTHTLQRNPATKVVAYDGIDYVHGSDSLALCVLCVRDDFAYVAVREDVEKITNLFLE